MCGAGDSRKRRRRIDGEAKRAFLVALNNGAGYAEAASAGGFCLATFYRARKADATFALRWREADAAWDVPRIIAPANGRRLQSRAARQLRFTEDRRETFLSHFAGTCNVAEAAAVAGVCEATVYRHRARDGAFATAFQLALEQGYARLEVEALRQRIEAQRRIGEAAGAAGGEGVLLTGEAAGEFERVLKLLDRWDRRNGRIGPRAVSPEHRPALNFDEAIEALAKRLRALDIPIKRLPAPGEAT